MAEYWQVEHRTVTGYWFARVVFAETRSEAVHELASNGEFHDDVVTIEVKRWIPPGQNH